MEKKRCWSVELTVREIKQGLGAVRASASRLEESIRSGTELSRAAEEEYVGLRTLERNLATALREAGE